MNNKNTFKSNIPRTPGFFQNEKNQTKIYCCISDIFNNKFTSYECPLHVYKSCLHPSSWLLKSFGRGALLLSVWMSFMKLFEQEVFSQQTAHYQITWRIRKPNHDHSLIRITINKSASSVDSTDDHLNRFLCNHRWLTNFQDLCPIKIRCTSIFADVIINIDELVCGLYFIYFCAIIYAFIMISYACR